MVVLAMYKGGKGLGSRLIRWWTKSIYSHCELVVDGVAYSSSIRDGGVRAKAIEWNPKHWDFFELPWAEADYVLSLYRETKGEPYGYLDLIKRQIFNRTGDSVGWFCSEWCATALMIFNAQMYSPAVLLGECLRRNDNDV